MIGRLDHRRWAVAGKHMGKGLPQFVYNIYFDKAMIS